MSFRSSVFGRQSAVSVRPVGASDFDVPVLAGAEDADAPWVAADLAVLDERTPDVRLEINLDLLAAIRTRHVELIVH